MSEQPTPDPAVAHPEHNPPRSPDELRQELAVTVDELARRLDVPTRAKAWRDEKLAEAQTAARQSWEKVAAHPAGQEIARRPGVAVGVVLFVLLVVWRARRRRRRSQ